MEVVHSPRGEALTDEPSIERRATRHVELLVDVFLQLRDDPLLGRGGGSSGTTDADAL